MTGLPWLPLLSLVVLGLARPLPYRKPGAQFYSASEVVYRSQIYNKINSFIMAREHAGFPHSELESIFNHCQGQVSSSPNTRIIHLPSDLKEELYEFVSELIVLFPSPTQDHADVSVLTGSALSLAHESSCCNNPPMNNDICPTSDMDLPVAVQALTLGGFTTVLIAAFILLFVNTNSSHAWSALGAGSLMSFISLVWCRCTLNTPPPILELPTFIDPQIQDVSESSMSEHNSLPDFDPLRLSPPPSSGYPRMLDIDFLPSPPKDWNFRDPVAEDGNGRLVYYMPGSPISERGSVQPGSTSIPIGSTGLEDLIDNSDMV